MAAIGKMMGVKTPVIDALITLAAVINGQDYRGSGLTLEKMGLADVDPQDLPLVLREGFEREHS
jgi:opine dehydrogenase